MTAAADRIAALESKVAELAGIVDVLVQSTRVYCDGKTAIEVQRELDRTAQHTRAQATRRRELLALAEPARSEAFLALAAIDQLALFKTLGTQDAKQAFAGSWFWASDLAAALVLECNLAWRTAQLSASVLVRTVIDAGRTPESVTEEDVVKAVREHAGVELTLAAGFVDSVRSPAAIVRSRIVPGGPAPEDLAEQIRTMEARMATDAVAVAGIERRHAAADALLDKAVAEILSG